MKVMVIGGGGREHAIVRALKKSPRIDALYALPGNGGMAADAVCVPVKTSDIEGVVAFGREHGIDFAVVAPDDPLVMGMVDALEAAGIRCFGPNRAAAVIEGSKAFAKDLMQRYHIPTAAYAVFTEQAAAAAVDKFDKQREKYYTHYTGRPWGLPENYDLCVNSARLGIDRTAALLAEHCRQLFQSL